MPRKPPTFDQEAPTRPDGPVLCPKCVGDDGLPAGYVKEIIWEGPLHRRTVLVTCELCEGRKIVGREAFEHFRATQGF